MYLPFCLPLTVGYRRYFYPCVSLNSTFFVLMSYIKCHWRWHIHVSFLLWFWVFCASSTCAFDCVLTPDSYTKYHKSILFIESAFTWAGVDVSVQLPFTYAKPEAACAVLGSWWWAVCRPKHVELYINMHLSEQVWTSASSYLNVQQPSTMQNQRLLVQF
jgi:hypothetical protein